MPARNVARTLRATYDEIPAGCVDEVVLVDNKSKDETVAIAEELGLTIVRHSTDRGYGGSLKSCLTAALERGADFILELHPDNQYNTELVPALLARAKEDPRIGLVMGSRFIPPRRALEGGMPRWKYVSNRVLSAINSVLLGTYLSEFHTGFRVYNAEYIRKIPYLRNSDDFVFSFQVIVQAIEAGYRVVEIPAFSRYFEAASSNPLKGSLRYGAGTVLASLRFRLGRLGLG